MKLLDIARTMYVHIPKPLHRLAAPLAAMLPVGLRYGRTYQETRERIRRSETDPDFVREEQDRALQALFATAGAGSRHYRRLFAEIYGRPEGPDAVSLAAFRELPVLQKAEVRRNPLDFLARPVGETDEVSTSGSSGEPLSFYLDKDRSVRELAFVNHIWARIGYRDSEVRAVLRGVQMADVDRKPWEWDAALGELRLSPFHLTPEVMDLYLELIDRYRATFVHGYPSALAILCAHIVARGWSPRQPIRGILPISESLFDYQRALIADAFGGVPVMPFYGLSEKVAIAGEVPGQPDVYEFEPLYGLNELVDDDGRLLTTPGDRGRLIGTSFICSAMPLLRYDTGDTGTLVQAPGPDNCYRLRLSAVRSRWSQEFLVGADGALISMTAINVHSPVYARIQAFQFFQDTVGQAVFRAQPKAGENIESIQPLVDEIQAKVGRNLAFRLELVETLETNPRGKRPFIVQRLETASGKPQSA